jgi:hypothetical protein
MKRELSALLLFPNHLNLNGDLGNMTVLEHALRARGVTLNVIPLLPGNVMPLSRPDFILLGHGPVAAWNELKPSLSRLLPVLSDWLDAGSLLLAIGSGFEALHVKSKDYLGSVPDISISISQATPRLRSKERVSKFVLIPAGENFLDKEVLGYINSDTNAAALSLEGRVIGSMLHGPVLAKNPALVARVVEMLGVEESGEPLENEKTASDQKVLDGYLEIVWNLERQLASE